MSYADVIERKRRKRSYARWRYLANPEKFIARAMAWTAANPERRLVALQNWNRRRREMRAAGRLGGCARAS